jgi:hypothetical protein
MHGSYQSRIVFADDEARLRQYSALIQVVAVRDDFRLRRPGIACFTQRRIGGLRLTPVRRKHMTAIDRRMLLRDILPGAAAAAAIATVGVTLIPKATRAVPLANDKTGGVKDRQFAEPAQVVVVGPRRGWRGRRRWVCWWRRGRRVCGWRWV